MDRKEHWWLHHPASRLLQHGAFWTLSFVVFLQLFKTGSQPEKIDYIYTALFHATLLPALYINLVWLLGFLNIRNRRWLYPPAAVFLILIFSAINYSFFQQWSQKIFPDYFFISYFSFWQVCLFYVVYLSLSSLLKFSKSWFSVNELQRKLLQIEKEKVQVELLALKSQINPHFFFNTLNGIYSMSLDRDERLPQTILQLSHLMRYFLYEAKEDYVPLEKEWQVLQDYISLQQVRAAGRLHFESKLEGIIGSQQIAPLLLIVFLENAFKHGTGTRNENAVMKMDCRVAEKRFYFRLENNKGRASGPEENEFRGMGLANVKRRLDLLYKDRHKLEITDRTDSFAVMLELEL